MITLTLHQMLILGKSKTIFAAKKKKASNHYSMLRMIKEESGLVSGLELRGLDHLLLAAFVLSFPLLHLNDFNFNLTSMNKVWHKMFR